MNIWTQGIRLIDTEKETMKDDFFFIFALTNYKLFSVMYTIFQCGALRSVVRFIAEFKSSMKETQLLPYSFGPIWYRLSMAL